MSELQHQLTQIARVAERAAVWASGEELSRTDRVEIEAELENIERLIHCIRTDYRLGDQVG